ncbi:MAG: undecaprenyl-phosphate glucose phosphotransferase [Lachnospiraceae bacterium]|nr:undecaprenyl-phosphate glucose phosphotransferase [Bacillota bacterium]MCI6595052.1 undecaprenyl-phosphate glucose phosphotransferase [Bacillota bacterium]MDD7253772.1 undecaprenyl-phosphate glucose phosphotransferase [Bacillota bacterium]MDO5592058.1 undecaprenyl-phosphate glucose phosphotransferase [Bacillota bacterium]MDY2950226.1 undecaprenyl-phosphate glucose phosphotransferase [Lachnospiraceae bacterium]
MIKDNQIFFNRMHIVLDGLVVAVSFLLAWAIKFLTPLAESTPGVTALSAETYFRTLYFIVPGYLILYGIYNLYSSKRSSRIRVEVAGIFKANTVGIGLVMISFFMLSTSVDGVVDFSRTLILLFYVINMILTFLYRMLVRKFLYFIRRKGNNLKHVILVGYSRAAEAYLDRIASNPQWGYVVHGILDDHVPRGTLYRGVKVLGSLGNLEYILPENKMDEIAITLSLEDYDSLEHIVDLCERAGVHTKFIPDYGSLFPSRPYTEDLMGLPVINIRYVPLSNTWNALMKRLVDIFGSIFCIILFSPVMLFAAVGTRVTSKGPIIYRQTRIGLHSKPFTMYKFRTMRVQSAEEEKKGWTIPGDDRVTKFGSFLRRTSIDEMPQFFNVLAGKMSLVGPRPERPQFVDKFREEIPRYMVKHQVRPGITGWAQINGYRGDTSIRKRIEHDIYYIENWSLGFDFRILFLTVFKGFINKNAY